MRSQVEGLEGGSYDEVTQQLRRLASQALPVCIDRETPADESDNGDLTRPGINCREVK